MPQSFDLTKLEPNTFEHLVNMLVLKVLGAGGTSFGPGPDGGRDGYFAGEAPYPSDVDRWTGKWIVQSKFHKPHLSTDPQKWLLDQIRDELKQFNKKDSGRTWPDIWIIATNIDPSGAPHTGAFDKARDLVKKARPELENRFHIWGGQKILSYLALHPSITEYFAHFITPGHIFTELYNQITDSRAEPQTILSYLINRLFNEQQYTKLEQAGSEADVRPGIHALFIDLPYEVSDTGEDGMSIATLVRTSGNCHRAFDSTLDAKEWQLWNKHPSRAKVWFVKGGPGQGKSTLTQYFSQIQRAALLLQDDCSIATQANKLLAQDVKSSAEKNGFWPQTPRIPITIELKDYAQWFGVQSHGHAQGILTYLSEKFTAKVEQTVQVGTLKRLLGCRSWFVVFDGLDEVPHDVKDAVANEIVHFVNNVSVECNSDLLTICTSRPQGYSGQFSRLVGPTIELVHLSPDHAIKCAEPVLKLGRTPDEASKYISILTSAVKSDSVRELMTTPLQSHIMAVVVRDGGRPPERRWQLFSNFYNVIKRREANRDLPDIRIAKLLRENEQLLKSVHNRLGFLLHARAETSSGAQTHLHKSEFRELVEATTKAMLDDDIEETVATVMEATAERLVLVNTPDDGNHVRFDVRQLQEFFAAEFIYESTDTKELRERLEVIADDSHWREVMHFLLSALIESSRNIELTIAVDVLYHINEGTGDSYERTLCRRIANGAIFTARLLNEGVLEQDKRIRAQFRKCIEPIAGFVSPPHLVGAITSKPSASSTWLISILMESLNEYDLSENIGSAIILVNILQDRDSRIQNLLSFLKTTSNAYRNRVISSHNYHSFRRTIGERTPPIWLKKMALDRLLNGDWRTLDQETGSAIFEILRNDKKSTMQVGQEISLNELESHILEILIHEAERDDYEELGLGIISAACAKYDWTKMDQPLASKLDEIALSRLDARGFLKYVKLLVVFFKMKNKAAFDDFFEFAKDSQFDILVSMPEVIRAYLPFQRSLSCWQNLQRISLLSNAEFTELFRYCRIGDSSLGRPLLQLHLQLHLDDQSTLEQWITLSKTWPDLALELWGDTIWNEFKAATRPAVLDTEAGISALLQALLAQPHILCKFPGTLGRMLSKAPQHSGQLRGTILNALSDYNLDTHSVQCLAIPFELNLELEAGLLPLIVSAIDSHVSLNASIGGKNMKQEIEYLITAYIPNSNQLLRISNEDNFAPNIRFAATLLYSMHPKGNALFESCLARLTEFPPNKIPMWVIKAIRMCMLNVQKVSKREVRAFIGRLLEMIRDNYQGRYVLQPLINSWRETANAPVTTSKLEKKWLLAN